MSPVRRQISPHASRLRQNMTDAEHRLWKVLRNRQLGGFKFRRQATIDRYVVDFLCPEVMLVVELDGGQHSSATDAARTAILEARGYRVLRFWNSDVMEGLEAVAKAILEASVIEKKTLTQPSPAKAGEG